MKRVAPTKSFGDVIHDTAERVKERAEGDSRTLIDQIDVLVAHLVEEEEANETEPGPPAKGKRKIIPKKKKSSPPLPALWPKLQKQSVSRESVMGLDVNLLPVEFGGASSYYAVEEEELVKLPRIYVQLLKLQRITTGVILPLDSVVYALKEEGPRLLRELKECVAPGKLVYDYVVQRLVFFETSLELPSNYGRWGNYFKNVPFASLRNDYVLPEAILTKEFLTSPEGRQRTLISLVSGSHHTVALSVAQYSQEDGVDLSPCLVWLHENFAYLKALSRELIDAIVAASEKDTLDSLLINLIRTKAQITARKVGFAESLLFHGASTLHPDRQGFLLLTNVRAGFFYGSSKNHGFNYVWRNPISDNLDNLPRHVMTFESLDVQWSLVELLTSFGANWSPQNHLRFPEDFRNRVICLFGCNLQLRVQGQAWLPRDPMRLLLRELASLEYTDDATQLNQTRSLLKSTFGPLNIAQLLHICAELWSHAHEGTQAAHSR